MWNMRYRRAVVAITSLLALTSLSACGEDEDDTPPPPRSGAGPGTGTSSVTGPGTTTTTTTTTPPGPVMVTVVANSTPPGAMVTGGGRQLGITPLQTQVPIPAPQPGQVQTFAFTFQLAGYQTTTINASPVNNTISITAGLAPNVVPTVVEPQPVGGTEGTEGTTEEPGGGGPELRVSGQGGGAIYDNHTTTGFAVVNESCVIDRLSVTLNGHHSYFADLHITLRDPQGNSYSIARGGRANPFRSHTVRRAVGRQAQGRWTLAIADRLQADSGNLNGWSMRFTCRGG